MNHNTHIITLNKFKSFVDDLINYTNDLIKSKLKNYHLILLDNENVLINSTDYVELDVYSNLLYLLCNDQLDDFLYYIDYGIKPNDKYTYIECEEHNNLCMFLLEEINKKYDIKVLESKLGEEDGGSYCYGVIKLNDLIFKCTWAYYSFQGSYYDDILDTLKLVKPVERIVIFYE